MRKFLKPIAPLLASIMLLQGCQGDGDAAPVGSTLTIAPSEVTWNISNPGACDPNVFADRLFVITANDPTGAPLGETDLLMTLQLAANTSNFPAMFLIADTGSLPGVVDPGDTVVSELGDGGYATKTNSEGIAKVIVRMTLSCTYRGSLDVFGSGGLLFQTVSLAVEEDEGN